MERKWKKLIAVFMAAAIALVSLGVSDVYAAINAKTPGITEKTLKLSNTDIQLKAGKSRKVNIKNTSGVKIKSVKWSVTKGKNIVKLSNASKQSVTVKAIKQGTATIQAKIKTAKGTVARTAKVKVLKKSAPQETEEPEVTEVPSSAPSDNVIEDTSVSELIHYNMSCSEDGKHLLDQSGNGNYAELFGVNTTLQQNQSLLLEKGAYIKLLEKVFAGRSTMTISIWLKNYSGTVNTSAMFVGTKEEMPVSYWLLNPSNPAGRMKSVMTNSRNAKEPFNTEVGISPSIASKGTDGPFTGTEWNNYVTVITADSITGYFNGKKAGTSKLDMNSVNLAVTLQHILESHLTRMLHIQVL